VLNTYLDLRRGWIACVIVDAAWIEAPWAFPTWWEADAASVVLPQKVYGAGNFIGVAFAGSARRNLSTRMRQSVLEFSERARPPHIERLAHHSLRGDPPRPGAEEDHRGLVRSG
jgi:hypothetical protein